MMTKAEKEALSQLQDDLFQTKVDLAHFERNIIDAQEYLRQITSVFAAAKLTEHERLTKIAQLCDLAEHTLGRPRER